MKYLLSPLPVDAEVSTSVEQKTVGQMADVSLGWPSQTFPHEQNGENYFCHQLEAAPSPVPARVKMPKAFHNFF